MEQAASVKRFDANAPLAVICGAGRLPQEIIEYRKQAAQPTFVVALEGYTPVETAAMADHVWLRIGAVGAALEALRNRNIRQLVMAGTMRRPSLRGLLPDAKGRALLARLGGSLFAGDDKLLRAIITFFEDEGMLVVGAHEVMGDILCPEGLLTVTSPTADAQALLAKGVAILHDLAKHDVGQAIILHEQHVIGIEAAEGTAALIERCAALKGGNGGILIKCRKAGQTERADMPSVGLETIEALHQYAYDGLYVEAHGSLMMDKAAMIKRANEYGLFVEGFVHHGS